MKKLILLFLLMAFFSMINIVDATYYSREFRRSGFDDGFYPRHYYSYSHARAYIVYPAYPTYYFPHYYGYYYPYGGYGGYYRRPYSYRDYRPYIW